MSDPDLDTQRDLYEDPDQDTPVRPRPWTRQRAIEYQEYLDKFDYEMDTPEPASPGHETACVCCGVLLWSWTDDDKACRSCEKGW